MKVGTKDMQSVQANYQYKEEVYSEDIEQNVYRPTLRSVLDKKKKGEEAKTDERNFL